MLLIRSTTGHIRAHKYWPVLCVYHKLNIIYSDWWRGLKRSLPSVLEYTCPAPALCLQPWICVTCLQCSHGRSPLLVEWRRCSLACQVVWGLQRLEDKGIFFRARCSKVGYSVVCPRVCPSWVRKSVEWRGERGGESPSIFKLCLYVSPDCEYATAFHNGGHCLFGEESVGILFQSFLEVLCLTRRGLRISCGWRLACSLCPFLCLFSGIALFCPHAPWHLLNALSPQMFSFTYTHIHLHLWTSWAVCRVMVLFSTMQEVQPLPHCGGVHGEQIRSLAVCLGFSKLFSPPPSSLLKPSYFILWCCNGISPFLCGLVPTPP